MRDKYTLQPTTDAGEILRRINRFIAEEDETQTIEELRQSLRDEGIDPDEALATIRKRLAPYLTLKEKPEAG